MNDGDVDERFTALKDLWWEQRFLDERLNVLAGQIELQGLMNANTYADDDTFCLLAQPVATNPATLIVPAGLGAFAQVASSEHGYLSLAFVDAVANGEYPDFESSANGEYLYAAELALTPQIPRVGPGTYRFTGFWRDETEAAPRPRSGLDRLRLHVGRRQRRVIEERVRPGSLVSPPAHPSASSSRPICRSTSTPSAVTASRCWEACGCASCSE